MNYNRELELFVCNNKSITYGDILDSLLAVDADQCDVLLLHTAMKFGTMARSEEHTSELQSQR